MCTAWARRGRSRSCASWSTYVPAPVFRLHMPAPCLQANGRNNGGAASIEIGRGTCAGAAGAQEGAHPPGPWARAPSLPPGSTFCAYLVPRVRWVRRSLEATTPRKCSCSGSRTFALSSDEPMKTGGGRGSRCSTFLDIQAFWGRATRTRSLSSWKPASFSAHRGPSGQKQAKHRGAH